MNAWLKYWNHDAQVNVADPLRQVGKTVNGIPINAAQFAAIVQDIRRNLALAASDLVLDLCCGNGVLTREVARFCDRMVGVDFSARLIDVAQHQFCAPVIDYVLADACALPLSVTRQAFDKIFIYEALQHFDANQAEEVLAQIGKLSRPPQRLYIASVPDAARIWNYYDTAARREEYERRVSAGTEAIGHWWHKQELEQLLVRHDYRVVFCEQSPQLHSAHYRFDAVAVPAYA